MELNKFELASVKRTYNNVKRLYAKRDKIQEAIEAKQEELAVILDEIEVWESPIRIKYGMTPEQILNPVEVQDVPFEEPTVCPNCDNTECNCGEEDATPETPAVATGNTPWGE